MNNNPALPVLGFPEEWKDFSRRHGTFLNRLQNLYAACTVAFEREAPVEELIDRVVYFSGCRCREDFGEILVLCENGYGSGAYVLLRGMFERCVTARYLHLNPVETQNFLDYGILAERRLLNHVRSTFGQDSVPKERLEKVEARYQQVKHKFEVPVCKACGTTRINAFWTELDFVSMAKKAGAIGKLILPAYAIPTLEAHATVRSLSTRVVDDGGDRLVFDGGPQRHDVDGALLSAHNVLLSILELQQDHFGLDALREPLQTCLQDFMDIWCNPDPANPSGADRE